MTGWTGGRRSDPYHDDPRNWPSVVRAREETALWRARQALKPKRKPPRRNG